MVVAQFDSLTCGFTPQSEPLPNRYMPSAWSELEDRSPSSLQQITSAAAMAALAALLTATERVPPSSE